MDIKIFKLHLLCDHLHGKCVCVRVMNVPPSFCDNYSCDFAATLMGFECLLDWSCLLCHGRLQLLLNNEQWLLSKFVYLNLNYTASFIPEDFCAIFSLMCFT